jgi:hypothetical protein
MAHRYYHHSFFGLLLYLASHFLAIYYLAWMLVGYAGLEKEWHFLADIFPPKIYRLILPGILFGSLLVYYTIVYILRKKKLE